MCQNHSLYMYTWHSKAILSQYHEFTYRLLNKKVHHNHTIHIPPHFMVKFGLWNLRICRYRLLVHTKDLSQNWHLYGLSPVCFLICIPSLAFDASTFPHTVHTCLNVDLSDMFAWSWLTRFLLLFKLKYTPAPPETNKKVCNKHTYKNINAPTTS